MELPADGFVLEGYELSADESAMTGETDPLPKASFAECIKSRDEFLKAGNVDQIEKNALSSPILLSGTRVYLIF